MIAAWRSWRGATGIGELCVLNVDVVKEFDGVDGATAPTRAWTAAGLPAAQPLVGVAAARGTSERTRASPATS